MNRFREFYFVPFCSICGERCSFTPRSIDGQTVCDRCWDASKEVPLDESKEKLLKTKSMGINEVRLDEAALYEGHFSRIADKIEDDKYQAETAKEIAADWHGGQWSPLYKVACGNLGKMTAEDIQGAIHEVEKDLVDCEPEEAERLELLKAILEDRA